MSVIVSILLMLTIVSVHSETAPAIAFDTEEYQLSAGKSVALKAIITPDEKLKLEWSSSDETVATVNAKGVVKGIAPGEATITVRSAKYEELSTSCKVTVSRAVKSIKVPKKKITIAVGTKWTIEPEILPEDATNKKLEWSSSKEKVAIVDENGTITGLAVGTAKITAKATDGSNAKAEINVKVDKYDLVFNTSDPQTATWYHGSGRYVVTGKTKTGCVSIPDMRIEMWAMVVGGLASDDVEVTPVKPGEDTITIRAGRTKTVIRAFVSPDAFKDEEPDDDGQTDSGTEDTPDSNSGFTETDYTTMERDEITESGTMILEWAMNNVSVLASYEAPTEENENRSILRIGCFIDDEPEWGYTEEVKRAGEPVPLQAFIAGTENNPKVIAYNPNKGLVALGMNDGTKQWSLTEKTSRFGNEIIQISDAESGILYIAGTKGSRLAAVSPDGTLIWKSGDRVSKEDKPVDIRLDDDGIEIVYEDGKTAKFDFDGKLKD